LTVIHTSGFVVEFLTVIHTGGFVVELFTGSGGSLSSPELSPSSKSSS